MSHSVHSEAKRSSSLAAGALVTEYWREFACASAEGVELREAFSLEEHVGDRPIKVVYYESAWGREYAPKEVALWDEPLRIESLKGRSSAEVHPQIFVYGASGAIYSYAVAWSGNWVLELRPDRSGFTIKGGLSDRAFCKKLAFGRRWTTPKVVGATSASGSLNEIGNAMRAWAADRIPRNALSDLLPVEWNHWWAYEDKLINEETFLRNADAAAAIGVEVCTLDAGWFGSDDEGEHWFDVRGDWHKVNAKRFPRGIRYLSDYVRSKGMKFGLWCEIEGLGAKADLCNEHPRLVAKRDGAFLGYVCLGSEEAQAWAIGTLSDLIERYACDWIKLDFNLDPGLGCDCADHGHGPDEGLVAHYEGLYRVLETVRGKYPEVVLENCSSGGLRTDLGMMAHMHLNFLSDPDYSEHQLQAFWAATLSLPPQKCLHWMWSTTVGAEDARPFPSFDLSDASVSDGELAYHMRAAMLHAFGLSHRLPAYGEDTLGKLGAHIRFYKEQVRDRIRDAAFFRLTPQAGRGGTGAGWNAFQFARPDGEGCAFIFRLAHGEDDMRIRFEGLTEGRAYSVEDIDVGRSWRLDGRSLMRDGLVFDDVAPLRSRFLTIVPLSEGSE
ncbi:alpha-galactosidase [Paenibacillaceae bacterium WGS1546]|uniref:alpha-galactosidase n=1 Tax=Cohnella sp. WGS1546 TaxID=3366810 RepID=UPI00372D5162